MKVIKVTSAQNSHYPYSLNRAIDIMKQHKCGGVSDTGGGIVKINPWSEKVANNIKESLSKLGITFTEEGK